MSEPIARTIKDFCQAYGISRRQTYRLIDDGKLEAVKVGTATRIIEKSARQWFAALPRIGAYPSLTGTNK
jgi:excisionase family DNA binding protein